jgi:hypothetical protein
MLEFNDVTSRKGTNELGQSYFTNTIRVLPSAHRIAGNEIAFAGKDNTLGVVMFTGTLDRAALKVEQAGEPSATGKPVLKGDVTFGGKSFEDAQFTWLGGD